MIAGVPSDFPALRSMDVRPNNLPLQLTSLVGRTDEIATAIETLERHRLVTLTGPGGTGKTRLAVEVAETAPPVPGRRLPSGARRRLRPGAGAFCGRPGAGVKEGPGRSLSDALVDWLSDKEALVVLDNFEQLLEAAPVVERLLGQARGSGHW